MIGFNDLRDFSKILNGEKIEEKIEPTYSLFYSEEDNCFILNSKGVPIYRKVPEITIPSFIDRLKVLMAISGRYIPLFDKDSKNLLFTKEEFLEYRKKMSGIKTYGMGDYIFSDNLYFEGLDLYLNQINKNIEQVNEKRKPVIEEITKIIESTGLSVTIGCNSGGDVELVEAGSTARYTNIPSKEGDKWDFDFTVRIDADKVWTLKNTLESKFNAGGHITETAAYKVRLTDVVIPGLEKPIDLDFSLTPQKKKYLSTEDALSERLDSMKQLDEQKYRLVLANIMYAKNMLKTSGAYKPARGIINGGDRALGGLGGVGIENWIIQNGGSLQDATNEFLSHAEGKDFKAFEMEYVIQDFGQDHVATSKGNFPFDNFVMKNMRYKGFDIMKKTLKQFKNEYCEDKVEERVR